MSDKNLHHRNKRAVGAGAALRSAAALAPLLALSVGCDSFDLDSLEGGSLEEAIMLVSYPSGELRPEIDSITALGVIVRSQLGGNGTYSEKGGNVRTSREPTDAVVYETDDTSVRWVFSALQFNGSTIQEVMENNRVIQYTVTIKGETLQVRDVEDNSGEVLIAKGSMPWNSGRIEMDVRFSKGDYFESSAGGAESNLNRSVTGTIKTPSYTATLKTSSKFELVAYNGESAHFLLRYNDSSIKQGGTTYTWEGVRIKVNYKNGIPSNIDYEWGAVGKIKKNGSDWGEYDLVRKGELGVEVVLKTPGHTYTMERYHLLGSRASCTRSDECSSEVCTQGQCK